MKRTPASPASPHHRRRTAVGVHTVLAVLAVPVVLAMLAVLPACRTPVTTPTAEPSPTAAPTRSASPTGAGPVVSMASIFVGREAHVLGTWWWNADLIRTEADRRVRLDFLEANDVTEIYLSFGGAVWDSRYRVFVADCRERGIRVSALNGSASWLSDEGFAAFGRWLQRVADYQADAAETERFFGIHLDFEPHQDEAYAADPASMAGAVLRVYDLGRAFCDEQGLDFAADVSMWLDDPDLGTPDPDNPAMTLGEAIAQRVDTLSIMAYRDTAAAQFGDAQPMLRIALRNGISVVVGSETGQLTEAEFVTYFEEGKAVLVEQQGKLQLLMDGTGIPYGLAIHFVESWLGLKD